MAGVAFSMRRLLAEGGLLGPMRAFAFSALVSSGPWICSSIALAVLSTWGGLRPGSEEHRAFLSLISHAYAYSLIGSGAFQMLGTRFLADRLYEGRMGGVASGFAQLLVLLLSMQAVAGLLFLSQVPLPILTKASALTLYLALNGTWLSMVFLSASRRYEPLIRAFAWGIAASLLCGFWGGRVGGLPTLMAGYAAGHALTFLLMLKAADAELGTPDRPTRAIARDARRYASLILTGVAYNAGAWIDKLVAWHHPATGVAIAGALRAAPTYDNAMFLAYLTIVPALAQFTLKVETEFYDRYCTYFGALEGRASMADLARDKAAMLATLARETGTLVKLQGTLTLALMLFAPEALMAVHASWLSVPVFRAGVLGAMLHGLHMIALILLLYFDFRREAALVALTFLVTNGLFTVLTLNAGLAFHGFGYALSSAVTLAVGVTLLARGLERLEYHVFVHNAGRTA